MSTVTSLPANEDALILTAAYNTWCPAIASRQREYYTRGNWLGAHVRRRVSHANTVHILILWCCIWWPQQDNVECRHPVSYGWCLCYSEQSGQLGHII